MLITEASAISNNHSSGQPALHEINQGGSRRVIIRISKDLRFGTRRFSKCPFLHEIL